MKKTVVILLAAVVLGGFADVARAQTPAAATLTKTAAITYTGTITAIDPVARLITTRGGDGVLATWDVATNVAQAQVDGHKVGDVINVTYSDAISIRRKAAGEAAVDTVDPATSLRTATVTVTAVDLTARTLTVTGAKGRPYTRRVVDQANIDLLPAVKVGDRVDVSWYQTMQITTGATTTDEDSLRHRLTISALWGVDNQFSGKMIQAATGRTTGGAPINLDETSFDDVYGRMGLFKVGLGYRTSPRTEAVVNFVLSSSDSNDSATRVGTVGTSPQVPLLVNFTKYKYWGLEGGQRWFFARTRFTPYVGYLAGLNRHQDIRGTFVLVPPALTPGLAAQDGKIFEKSWAISVGPTGGVLIGLGPIEVMAETQLRFLGGLSDVDWLVEEGLRDINSESERWSLPLLVGARIRF
jgi:hypothetical protein